MLHAFDVSTPSRPVLVSVTPVGMTAGDGRGAGHIANFVSADCSQMWLDGGDLVEVHRHRRREPLPLQRLHPPQLQAERDTLLITEEDYIDIDETPPGGCRGQGKFETWSITMKPGGLRPLDAWMTEMNGSDSKAAATVNCSSHWFEVSRDLVAVGWYEQGTRFLDVLDPRNIRQVGFYLPANGSTWAAYWSPTDPTRSIVYTADAYLGVEVLRIDRKADLSTMPTLTAPVPASWFTTVPAYLPSDTWQFACPVNAVAVG